MQEKLLRDYRSTTNNLDMTQQDLKQLKEVGLGVYFCLGKRRV